MKEFLKENQKLLIIVGAIALVIVTVFSMALFSNRDEVPEAATLETVEPLAFEDEAEAAAMIKENTVKVTNQVGDSSIVGTGFFHESGYLVTNSHIVDIEGDITITYPDGEEVPGELVANDITSDVALVYVEDPKVLAMSFGSTMELQETDTVLSVGYQYNFEGEASVTKGSFSARRSAGGVEYLQSDISINPGGSGGPLFDSKGNLLGMSCLSDENSSMSMAISAETLENEIEDLIENPEVTYITGERPANALSTVLVEIGYDVTDLYGENEILGVAPEEASTEDATEGATSEVESPTQQPSDSGDDSGSSDGSGNTGSSNESPSQLPDDGGSDGSSGGGSESTPDEPEQGYITKIDRAVGIDVYFQPMYDSESGQNVYVVHWHYIDSDGVSLYPPNSVDMEVASSVEVDFYVSGYGQAPKGRHLKSYTFSDKEIKGSSGNPGMEYVTVPVSDIKKLLTPEDSAPGTTYTYLVVEVTVNTKEQGSFSDMSSEVLV